MSDGDADGTRHTPVVTITTLATAVGGDDAGGARQGPAVNVERSDV